MDGKKPYAVALLIQFIYTGMYVMSKAALDNGLSPYVFVFYRQASAVVLLAPLAFIFERKSSPPLKFTVLLKIFVHAFFGITMSSNMYNIGLELTSATVASAITNSVPVMTFFFAVLLRMEIINIKSISGKFKVLGVLFCLAGIFTIAFYEGPQLNPLIHSHVFNNSRNCKGCVQAPQKSAWIKGSFLMIIANAAWSLWLVGQGKLLKEFPSKFLLTTFECTFSTVQSFFVALVLDRNLSNWKLHFDIGLLSVLYCGFVVTGLSFYLRTWCIEKKGPVFLAVFTPLALVFTMLCSTFFLGERIHLGSAIGGVLLVGSLCCQLWGKRKECVVPETSVSMENSKSCNHQEKETKESLAEP